MDTLYLVYGMTYGTYIINGDSDYQPFALFKHREDAEQFAIKEARYSFDMEDANLLNSKVVREDRSRMCWYNSEMHLSEIGHEYTSYGTSLCIAEIKTDLSKMKNPNDILWIVFGTADRESFPEHYPLSEAFTDERIASAYMLRKAYNSIIAFNIPDNNINWYVGGNTQLKDPETVNKIFDEEDWIVELRLVPMTIQ